MSDKNTTFITALDLSDLSTIAPSDLPIVDLSEPEVTKLEAMVLKWLNPRNRAQHLWAIDYLTTKGEILSKGLLSSPEDSLTDWSQRLRDTPANELLIRNMTAAWRQKRYRDRQVDKKPYSFTLDTAVKAQLDRLAGRQKKTISGMLEDLITQAVLKAEKAETKRKLARSRETEPRATLRHRLSTVGNPK
ncbi:hypothetical protein [Pseudomonas sivasensis]|uniref:Transcriptional regulator n=1 Tax=Pseudomonas sivasensis TaxID=1880678 RepID=A0ABW8E6Q6_9PSED